MQVCGPANALRVLHEPAQWFKNSRRAGEEERATKMGKGGPPANLSSKAAKEKKKQEEEKEKQRKAEARKEAERRKALKDKVRCSHLGCQRWRRWPKGQVGVDRPCWPGAGGGGQAGQTREFGLQLWSEQRKMGEAI